MKKRMEEKLEASIEDFRLPRYDEIPNVGLYLEQTTKYIGEYLEPLQDISITSSMISNYVKKKLISNPIKKQYYREQIAYLIFIAIAKTVLSLEHIGLLLEKQKATYESKVAYNYFCSEFESIIQQIFGFKAAEDNKELKDSEEKILLRNIIITIAHKIHLDNYFNNLIIDRDQ
ncbi:DUF1836 domain-containing protein [Alloiococcus sp. CFN-8]|uniref:DUF1836 domain-containing protein n=1 Tax=Alloiococcus sp. CFN-8 TaxID=3416081 RepID=UPI003CF1B22B